MRLMNVLVTILLSVLSSESGLFGPRQICDFGFDFLHC